MRLIPRHRNRSRAVAPQIAISQAEITADLNYPAGARPRRTAARSRRQGSR